MSPRIAKPVRCAPDGSGAQVPSQALPRAEDAPDEAARGLLYVVPTPIGNVQDLSLRAIEVLRAADLIAAEDPRVTRRLLQQFAIETALKACAGQPAQIDEILVALRSGRTVALVCDAGAPAIADPGGRLIAAALDAGHRVSALPGPVAAIVALLASGLSPHRFAFDGFPPRGRADRDAYFLSLAGESRTLILSESARYLRSTLRSLLRVFAADRRIAIACNLTTPAESIWRGDLGAAQSAVGERPMRGAYTLVVECNRPGRSHRV